MKESVDLIAAKLSEAAVPWCDKCLADAVGYLRPDAVAATCELLAGEQGHFRYRGRCNHCGDPTRAVTAIRVP